jgi:hypothetical protein
VKSSLPLASVVSQRFVGNIGLGTHDLISGLVPNVWAGVVVPGIDPLSDRRGKLFDIEMGASTKPFIGQFTERSTRFIHELDVGVK